MTAPAPSLPSTSVLAQLKITPSMRAFLEKGKQHEHEQAFVLQPRSSQLALPVGEVVKEEEDEEGIDIAKAIKDARHRDLLTYLAKHWQKRPWWQKLLFILLAPAGVAASVTTAIVLHLWLIAAVGILVTGLYCLTTALVHREAKANGMDEVLAAVTRKVDEQLGKLKTQVGELTRQVTDFTAQNKLLEKQVAAFIKEILQLNKQVLQMGAENLAFKGENEKYQALNTKLREQLKTQANRFAAFLRQGAEQLEQGGNLVADIAELEQQVKDNATLTGENLTEAQALIAQIKELKATYETAIAGREALQASCERLQKENTALKARLEQHETAQDNGVSQPQWHRPAQGPKSNQRRTISHPIFASNGTGAANDGVSQGHDSPASSP